MFLLEPCRIPKEKRLTTQLFYVDARIVYGRSVHFERQIADFSVAQRDTVGIKTVGQIFLGPHGVSNESIFLPFDVSRHKHEYGGHVRLFFLGLGRGIERRFVAVPAVVGAEVAALVGLQVLHEVQVASFVVQRDVVANRAAVRVHAIL